MDIRYCKRCGKVYQATSGSTLCKSCVKSDDEEFVIVRDYVYENRSAGVPEIVEATGVDERAVLQFLRDGRLSVEGASGCICEKCKKPVPSGRYCLACSQELANVLNSAIRPDKKDGGSHIMGLGSKSKKMHISDRL